MPACLSRLCPNLGACCCLHLSLELTFSPCIVFLHHHLDNTPLSTYCRYSRPASSFPLLRPAIHRTELLNRCALVHCFHKCLHRRLRNLVLRVTNREPHLPHPVPDLLVPPPQLSANRPLFGWVLLLSHMDSPRLPLQDPVLRWLARRIRSLR